MPESEPLRAYDSRGDDYQRAFQVFLDHTNQKTQERDWLLRFVESLPRRDLFIDAGAGNGAVMIWLIDRFRRTIGIDPNPGLLDQFRQLCPQAEPILGTIMDADPGAKADLVLCSHVLYHIPRAEWLANLEKMASWLNPGGALVVVLQTPDSGRHRLLSQLTGQRYDLAEVGREFQAVHGDRFTVRIEATPARVEVPTFADAVTVTEFMINDYLQEHPRPRAELADYVQQHFARPDGSYRIPVDQDFLQIRLQ